MRTLVLAKTLKYFWNHIGDRFNTEDILRVKINQGVVYLANGDELIYISSPDKMRGYHGVDVVMWSKPTWFDAVETEALAKMARME